MTSSVLTPTWASRAPLPLTSTETDRERERDRQTGAHTGISMHTLLLHIPLSVIDEADLEVGD
jgi:hypothetical protein